MNDVNASEKKEVRFGNTEKVAELLCTTKQGVYNLISRGLIPHYKTGIKNSRVLFDLDEVENMIRSGRVEAFALGKKDVNNG